MAKKPDPKKPTREEKQKTLQTYVDGVVKKRRRGAPLGNKRWMYRLTSGRKLEFEDPEDLAIACLQYLVWCEENPLIEKKPFQYNGKIKYAEITKIRAPLIKQMCQHIGLSLAGWKKYTKREDELGDVARFINEQIHSIKLQGAYAGLLDATIAHRDLNMVERFDMSSTDGTLTPKQPDRLDLSKLTVKELKDLASLAERLRSDSKKPQGN